MIRKRLFCLQLTLILFTSACLFPLAANARDIYSDTWVAADGLDRILPTAEEAGAVKENKYVGIFYFLFMNSDDTTIIDHSKAYLKGGTEAVWEVLVQSGMHVWGEPYFGYYKNTDEWIYRKHAQLLSDAGIDFVFLDITNDNMYQHAWMTLFEVWAQIRAEGGTTPQIVFHCGNGADRMVKHMEILWEEIYGPEKYRDLWFMWEGKPLLLGNSDSLGQEYRNFFTIRASWAFNDWTGDGIERWPWIAEYPQAPGRNAAGEIEQVAVAAGFHSNSSRGRSYVNGQQTLNGKKDFGFSLDTTDLGIAFSEQWEYAIELDPDVIMVTGWNEFTMGRWENEGIGQLMASTYEIVKDDPQFENNYVDCFNTEYSRDIEPINGFFGDNYYYQMAYYIRLFKGVREIPEGTGSTAVDLSGDLGEFEEIGPVFYDTLNDITHRNHSSVGGVYTYINETGRNDIDSAKVSKADGYTYFYVQCANDIQLADGENWMNLLIDSDQSPLTGWEGYDYILNRSRENGTVTVERFVENDWLFEEVGKAEYVVSGNQLVIKVEDGLIGLAERDNFDFKWADNSTVTGDVMEFMDLGDAAPNGRFNYRYIKEGGRIVDPTPAVSAANEQTSQSTIIIIIVAAVCVCIAGIVCVVLYRLRTIKNKKS